MTTFTFTVPAVNETPADNIVNALNDLIIDWEGDSEGLVFYIADVENGDSKITAFPGDTVAITDGVVTVTKE